MAASQRGAGSDEKSADHVGFPAIAKWYGIADPQRQQLMWQGAKEMPRKPYPAVAGIKEVMELYNYHEMRLHKAEDFYDESLMREIDKSGFIDALYK